MKKIIFLILTVLGVCTFCFSASASSDYDDYEPLFTGTAHSISLNTNDRHDTISDNMHYASYDWEEDNWLEPEYGEAFLSYLFTAVATNGYQYDVFTYYDNDGNTGIVYLRTMTSSTPWYHMKQWDGESFSAGGSFEVGLNQTACSITLPFTVYRAFYFNDYNAPVDSINYGGIVPNCSSLYLCSGLQSLVEISDVQSSYTVTYVYGGYLNSNQATIVYDSPTINSFPSYANPGFTFVGWTFVQGGRTPLTTPYSLSNVNTTLYAIYDANVDSRPYITFSMTGFFSSVTTQYYTGLGITNYWYFSSIDLLVPDTVAGYSFDGWYFDASFTQPVLGSSLSSRVLTENITLYGKFTSLTTDTLIDGVFNVFETYAICTGKIANIIFNSGLNIAGYSVLGLILLGGIVWIILTKGDDD